MTKHYDARNEFKPFPNRGKGGALIEEPTFKRHPRARRAASAAHKEAKANHKLNTGPNVRIRTGTDRAGYSVVRLRDGVIVGGVGRV